jgi:ribonuclease D
LAAGVRNLPVLEGWRYEIFGRDALELVEGKLAFAVHRGKLVMTHIDDIHAQMAETQRADQAAASAEAAE